MNTARRLSIGLGAAAMMATLSPVAHAATETSEPTITTYQAAADYFGCRYHDNVLCWRKK